MGYPILMIDRLPNVLEMPCLGQDMIKRIHIIRPQSIYIPLDL